MTYIESFAKTGYSFEERVGEPREFEAALGRVALGFSYLDDRLSHTIGALLKIDSPTTSAVTAEMSFRNKVHLFASLVRLQRVRETFNVGDQDPEQYLRELIGACFKCEELRNTVMHSSWGSLSLTPTTTERRRKVTAKAARGVQVVEEELSAGDLLDIYDYCLYIDMEVEQLMLTYGEPSAAS